MNMKLRPLELYLHLPFCVRKCNYCDFLSAARSSEEKEQYLHALCAEIRRYGAELAPYGLTSVFLGGGTPSLLTPEELTKVMSTVYESFGVMRDAEITMEANPGTLDPEKLSAMRQAGINRLSLGLQSTENSELAALGRIHTYEDFLKTYAMARDAGFQNINIDLMNALPGQSLESWKNTLERVTALKPEHISAYSLIIEKETPFDRIYGEGRTEAERALAAGELGIEALPLPDEDTERAMYEAAGQILEAAGYHRYEISNYARKGFECRHNLGYWRRTEYIGCGLGASSLLMETRWDNEKDFQTYIAKVSQSGTGAGVKTKLSRNAQMEEYYFLGLRQTAGVEVKYAGVYAPVINKLMKEGLLLRAPGNRVRLSERGIDISNYVLADFILQ